MPADQHVIDQWSESARFWDKHRETIRRMYAPVTEALIEEAQIRRGQSVLDVATGPGEPALSVAEAVGPSGKVAGVDAVAGMIDAARRVAEDRKLTNVHLEVAAADHLPFATESFDAVISRFGMMFFPSPVDAVREMLRVLRPGRRLALAVWGFAERNPYHCTLTRIVERYTGPAAPAADAPEPFRYAAAGKLKEILDTGGASATMERLMHFRIEAPISPEEFWTLRFEMSLREKVAKLSAGDLSEIRREAVEALREYSTENGMSFPGEVRIVSGQKSDGATDQTC